MEEIQRLFSEGLRTPRDRALFGICLFTATRIREACTLRVADVHDLNGTIRTELIVRKGNTKGKLATRCIPIIDELRLLLNRYPPPTDNIHLFPARRGPGHLNPDSAGLILREAFRRVGIQGASTHSFRRTALTQMSNAGIPLRIIQEISDHRNLEQLQRYLEVKPEQVRGAIASISMLAPELIEQKLFTCSVCFIKSGWG